MLFFYIKFLRLLLLLVFLLFLKNFNLQINHRITNLNYKILFL